MSYQNCRVFINCRPVVLIFVTFIFMLLFPVFVVAELAPTQHDSDVRWLELMNQPTHPAPCPRPDLRPTEKSNNWQAMIDAVWGPGLPADEQLYTFQKFMYVLDAKFACFTNRDVDLVGLYTPYLAEISSGVSKGRFQAIMNRMCMALRNAHTQFIDVNVLKTTPEPGVPLLIGHRYGDNSHFGACLTTGDSGIFVYDVAADHPLGLEVGDVILGYEGRPWSELYQELLDAELPVGDGGWLTSDASYEYGWEISAGRNWHLFTTIDILKYSSGEFQHLPTSLMVDPGVDLAVFCSDQLNDEIPRPTYPDWATWGVLNVGRMRVGFIWCDVWANEVEAAWAQACLEMVNDPDLDGLIIDFRSNVGGNMFLSNEGLSHLFNETIPTVDFGERNDPNRHTLMRRLLEAYEYDIPGDPADYFDKPIAVLLGPRSLSSGDQVAYRMTFHPMARTFGRPTSATFDSPVYHFDGVAEYAEFWARYSKEDAGPWDLADVYLNHVGFPVDQEVWLEPEDCRNGVDTVIEAALDWIAREAKPHPGSHGRDGSKLVGVSPNPANPLTVIRFEIKEPGPCRLEIVDIAGRLIHSRAWTHLDTGPHVLNWDGSMDSGRSAASGAYLVRLVTADGVDRARVTLIK